MRGREEGKIMRERWLWKRGEERPHGRVQFYSQSSEVSSQTGSLAGDLKEEKATVKKLKGDVQQLEEELAEAKAEREATEKVGIEVECFTLHPPPPLLSPFSCPSTSSFPSSSFIFSSSFFSSQFGLPFPSLPSSLTSLLSSSLRRYQTGKRSNHH